MWQIVLYSFFIPPVTPANLFESSRQLCSFLSTHHPLLCCPNHDTQSLCSLLITSWSLRLLLWLAAVSTMWLLLQIMDFFAVAFTSRWFVLFAFAQMWTSLLSLLQVCKIYRTCFCASSWLASQLHLQCMAVFCGSSSCGLRASKWGRLFGLHFLMQLLKVSCCLEWEGLGG